jgi:hypothetical protein
VELAPYLSLYDSLFKEALPALHAALAGCDMLDHTTVGPTYFAASHVALFVFSILRFGYWLLAIGNFQYHLLCLLLIYFVKLLACIVVHACRRSMFSFTPGALLSVCCYVTSRAVLWSLFYASCSHRARIVV